MKPFELRFRSDQARSPEFVFARRVTRFAAYVAALSFLSSPAASATAIVAGPISNPTNGHTYYVLDAGTWTQAESTAVSIGGHLASLADDAENTWVWETFQGYGPFWIGFTDEALEGTFVWTSGEPATYTNWWTANGEPNNIGGIEHYAEMKNYVWNDNQDGAYFYAVIEISSPGGGPACWNTIDDDGDGLIDHGSDPGCQYPTSLSENPRCDNDFDDDGDGKIDWDGGGVGDPDPQCGVAWRNNEATGTRRCGLGFELVFLMPMIRWLACRRRGVGV